MYATFVRMSFSKIIGMRSRVMCKKDEMNFVVLFLLNYSHTADSSLESRNKSCRGITLASPIGTQ